MRYFDYKRGATVSVSELNSYIQDSVNLNLSRITNALFRVDGNIGGIFDEFPNQSSKQTQFRIIPANTGTPHEITINILPGNAAGRTNKTFIKLAANMSIKSYGIDGEAALKTFLSNAASSGYVNIYINPLQVYFGDDNGGLTGQFRNGLPITGDEFLTIDQAGAEINHFTGGEGTTAGKSGFIWWHYSGRTAQASTPEGSLITLEAKTQAQIMSAMTSQGDDSALIGTLKWNTGNWEWYTTGDFSNGVASVGLNAEPITLPTATDTVPGVVTIDNTNGLDITAGKISLDYPNMQKASGSQFGVVQIGDLIQVSSGGVISARLSTSSYDGMMSKENFDKLAGLKEYQAGDGISISGATIRARTDDSTIGTLAGVLVVPSP